MGAVSVPRLERHLDFGCKGFLVFAYHFKSKDTNGRSKMQYHVYSCLNRHEFVRIVPAFFACSIHDEKNIDAIKQDFLRLPQVVGGTMVFAYVNEKDFREWFAVHSLEAPEVIAEDVESYEETWA